MKKKDREQIRLSPRRLIDVLAPINLKMLLLSQKHDSGIPCISNDLRNLNIVVQKILFRIQYYSAHHKKVIRDYAIANSSNKITQMYNIKKQMEKYSHYNVNCIFYQNRDYRTYSRFFTESYRPNNIFIMNLKGDAIDTLHSPAPLFMSKL